MSKLKRIKMWEVEARNWEEFNAMQNQYHCEWLFEGRPADLTIVMYGPMMDCSSWISEGVKIIIDEESPVDPKVFHSLLKIPPNRKWFTLGG